MFAYSPVNCGSLYLIFIASAIILGAIMLFLVKADKIKGWFDVNIEDPNDRKKLNRFNRFVLFLIVLVLLAVSFTPYNPSFQALSRFNFLYAMCIEGQ